MSAERAAFNRRLWASLTDKLWFLDRLPSDVNVFADFGCADGKVLRAISEKRPRVKALIGYDHDPQCYFEAMPSGLAGVTSTTRDINAFTMRVHKAHNEGGKSCLILGSVIDEVLVQGTPWSDFWGFVQGLDCDYVAIRNTAVSEECGREPTPTLLLGDMLQRDDALCKAIVHVPVRNRMDFLRLLLVSRYGQDLAKEATEDYFIMPAELLLRKAAVGHSLKHFEHYSLPFLVEDWRMRYGAVIEDHTHVKMLLKKKARVPR